MKRILKGLKYMFSLVVLAIIGVVLKGEDLIKNGEVSTFGSVAFADIPTTVGCVTSTTSTSSGTDSGQGTSTGCTSCCADTCTGSTGY